jgi:hypothetical protein
MRGLSNRLRRPVTRLRCRGGVRRRDAGMNTAEYAVGTLAAVAFAGLLLAVLTSDPVRAALQAVVEQALG